METSYVEAIHTEPAESPCVFIKPTLQSPWPVLDTALSTGDTIQEHLRCSLWWLNCHQITWSLKTKKWFKWEQWRNVSNSFSVGWQPPPLSGPLQVSAASQCQGVKHRDAKKVLSTRCMWQLNHQPLKKPSFWLCFSPTENESNYRESSCPQVLHCYPCLRNAAVVFLKSLLPILTKQTRKSMYGFCPIDGTSFKEQNPTHGAGPVGCPRRNNVTAQNPWRCLPS